MTQIQKGKLTKAQIADSYSTEKPGTAYARFTVRIKNSTDSSVSNPFGVDVQASYSPDGRTADTSLAAGVDDKQITGKIVKGRAKTGDYTFLIPEKWWGDVAVEVQPIENSETVRESVVFAGAI